MRNKNKAKTRKLRLPPLRKLNKKNVKYTYKLKNSAHRRHLAINEGIMNELKYLNKKRSGKIKIKKAATAKKARFNILRIYRRNKNIKDCKKFTRDMKYMDKKYGLGKTKDICGTKTPSS